MDKVEFLVKDYAIKGCGKSFEFLMNGMRMLKYSNKFYFKDLKLEMFDSI